MARPRPRDRFPAVLWITRSQLRSIARAGREASIASRRDEPGFDLTGYLAELAADISCRLPDLYYVNMDRVTVSFSRHRLERDWGIQARLIPLRFGEGSISILKNGRRCRLQRLVRDGWEQLYLLTVYLPRFWNQSFEEKLVTLIHELYHIDPRFDGTIRRGAGGPHGGSTREYDQNIRRQARQYLALGPPTGLLDPLRMRFDRLLARHGRLFGLSVPVPKIVPESRRGLS